MTLDSNEEVALKSILEKCDCREPRICGRHDIFPEYMQQNYYNIMKSLDNKGYILGFFGGTGGEWFCYITPQAKTYFEEKKLIEMENKEIAEMSSKPRIAIGQINVEGSNAVNIGDGNVINSVQTVNETYFSLKRQIKEKGKEDEKELLTLLEEAKKITEEIQSTGKITKKDGFFERLKNTVPKYNWFFSGIMAFIGNAALHFL